MKHTIEIVKTFHGKKYAVLEPFTRYDAKGKPYTEKVVTEYGEKNSRVAVSDLSKDGHKQAKELLYALK